MEREVKKVKIPLHMMDDTLPIIKVDAYTTPVAGLVVHPARSYVYSKGEYRVLRRNRHWNISLYPTGVKVLSGIPSKEQAIEFVVTHLSEYKWIGLRIEDVREANDMKAMGAHFVKLRTLIADMQ